MRNGLKSTLAIDRLKLHRVVKWTVNCKKFQILTTRLANSYSHSYADDTCIYTHVDASSCAVVLPTVTACLDAINSWMASNRLKLNMEKTQIIWLGTAQQLTKVNIRTIALTAGADIQLSDTVTCLGVLIDRQLTFADHVKKLAGKCFYQLQQLRVVRRTLPTDAAKTLVHALISSRVDYCNSVLYGASAVHLRPLQSVLNGAARLIVGKRKYDHITDTMRRDLHWLPVQQRVQFKLCTLVSKCLRRMEPTYLADTCTTVSSQPVVNISAQLLVTTWQSRAVGWRDMDHVALQPLVHWSGTELAATDCSRLRPDFSVFCSRLKSELFKRASGGHTAPSW